MKVASIFYWYEWISAHIVSFSAIQCIYSAGYSVFLFSRMRAVNAGFHMALFNIQQFVRLDHSSIKAALVER